MRQYKISLIGGKAVVLVSLVLAISSTALAGIYDVFLDAGGTGVAFGDIVTDGTIGPLGPANIVTWSLTVQVGGDGVGNLLEGPAGSGSFVSGTGLIATPNQLLFDFSQPTEFAFYDSNDDFLCFGTGSHCPGAGVNGGVIGINDNTGIVTGGEEFSDSMTGLQPVANGTLPEPRLTAFVFALFGIMGLIAVQRRKSRRTARKAGSLPPRG